ncbi:MAG: hypothetical protein ACHQYP_11270 [Nitrospiria bacterium]
MISLKISNKCIPILLLMAVFFLQTSGSIIFNGTHGIHFGKRNARLAPPVKKQLAVANSLGSMEDISIQDSTRKIETFNEGASELSYHCTENSGCFVSHRLNQKVISISTSPIYLMQSNLRI